MEITAKGKKIIRIVAVVAAVVFGLIVYWAINSRQAPVPGDQPKVQLDIEKPASFTGQLPYSGDNFTISYLADEDVYIVNIYDEPAEEAKTNALKYLEKNGAVIPPSSVSYFYGPGVGGHAGP